MKTADSHQRKTALGIRILESCRTELYGAFPYMEGAFAGLDFQAEEGRERICTDGETLFFSPDLLLKKYREDPRRIRRGYLHMLLHCLYLHPFQNILQGEAGEERIWNLACDICVEQVLEKEKVPCIIILNRFSETQDKNREKESFSETIWNREDVFPQQIYRKLMHSFSEGLSEKELEKLEQRYGFDDHSIWKQWRAQGGKTAEKWEQIRLYTAQSHEKDRHRAGMSAGSRAEEIRDIYKSRYDYRRFLRRFCYPGEEMELDTENFDFIPYIYGLEHYENMPFIEPLEYRESNRLEELVIAIDTSGSCSAELVQHFLEETYSILSTRENFFKKMKVYLLQCDCCIQNVTVIHSEEEWKQYCAHVKIEGRGGTDFRPVFEYIRKLNEKEKREIKKRRTLIYFTDGDGIYPREKPEYEAAFVFLNHTEAMKAVPSWAIRLVVNE